MVPQPSACVPCVVGCVGRCYGVVLVYVCVCFGSIFAKLEFDTLFQVVRLIDNGASAVGNGRIDCRLDPLLSGAVGVCLV